jgi:molybdopterin/thiamine biosynthesis adenylyltransferase
LKKVCPHWIKKLKLIVRLGESLVGRLLLYDSLAMEFRELTVRKNKGCPACAHPEKIQYQQAKPASFALKEI